ILPDQAAPGGTRKIHFDDREQAIAALRARSVGVVDFVPGRLIPTARAYHPGHSSAAAKAGATVRHAARPRPADSTGETR
ncbi:MAG TPA: hypothetical protein VEB22_04890, partial [Phycisphaerales bacterium]|nr:hypothetical protein [Phycisphaerales bacterium]